jgi:uncharacterized protein YjdB
MSNVKHLVLFALAACSGLLLAACQPKVDVAPAQPTLSSISVAPNAPMVAVGRTQALTVTGTFSDSSTLDLTASSTFLSSDTAVARVSGTGAVSAVKAGSATITASALGKTATATVTVPAAALISIAVAAVPPILVGGTHALTVTATYADATTGTLTSGLTYATSDGAVASVSIAGLVSGLKAGTATVTVTETASGKTATALVTVNALSYAMLDFNAAGFMNTPFGGAAASKTSTAVPSGGPSNPVVQLIKTAGALCYAGNTMSVGASMSIGVVPFSATATTITVQMYVPIAGVVIKLKVEDLHFPGDASKSVETDVTPTATGWQTLTFNFASPSAGTASINLANTYNKISIFADFTCVNGNPAPLSDEVFYVGPVRFIGAAAPAAPPLPFAVTLSSIAITPNPVNLAPAATRQLTVTATYSDASTATTTAGATFSSDATNFATVSNPGGLVTAVANGTATITATDTASGKSATVLVTVATAGIVNGLVFTNGALDTGITFAAFGGGSASAAHPPTVDSGMPFTDGSAALKVVVDSAGTAPAGTNFAGGAFVANAIRDLRTFNALTFWAKADKNQATLKVQLGVDGGAGANVDFKIESIGTVLTTNWQQYVIPMPDPTKANGIDGLFSFADGLNGYTVWFANVQYLQVPANVYGSGVADGDGLQSAAAFSVTAGGAGSTRRISPATNSIHWTLGAGQLNGSPVVTPLPNGKLLNDDSWRWYTLTAAPAGFITVGPDGLVTGVNQGSATITGTMAGVAIPGQSVVTVTAPLAAPVIDAPTPALAAGNVIALYDGIGLYTPVPVDNFNTNWCGGVTESPYPLPSGTAVRQYGLNACTGIAFGDGSAGGSTAHTINASAAGMTSFHVDLWSPNPVRLRIQIINNAAGSPSVTGELDAGTIAANSWVSIDQPMSNFAGLTAIDKLQQIGFFPNSPGMVLYVDNLYFYK